MDGVFDVRNTAYPRITVHINIFTEERTALEFRKLTPKYSYIAKQTGRKSSYYEEINEDFI
jgi:hypothetical protein